MIRSSHIKFNRRFETQILIKKIFLPFLTAILLYSCNVTQKIPVQVALPPKHPISEDIQSLAILNRSITKAFTNLQRDSLESILIAHDLRLDTIMYDSIAADTTIQVAARTLFQSDRFDVVVPKNRIIVRNDKGGLIAPLDINFINGICKDFNVNAVLVLESFKERVITDLKAQQYYLGFESTRYNEYSGTVNVSYSLVWRLYQPGHNPPILRFNLNDTVFWNSFDYSLKVMYDKLPSLKEALIGGGIASGIDMANNISPKWMDETRRYYKTGKTDIDAAIPLIKENKWEEAATIWKKYADVSSKTLRSKIEFNLAVAAEMTGNMESAITWAKKSYGTKYTGIVESYLRYLSQRQSLLSKASKKPTS